MYCGQGPAAGLDKDGLRAAWYRHGCSLSPRWTPWVGSFSQPGLWDVAWQSGREGAGHSSGYRNLRQPRPACFPFTLTLSACYPSEPPYLLSCPCSHPQPLPRLESCPGQSPDSCLLALVPLLSLWGSARLRFSRTHGSGCQPGPRLDLLLRDFFPLPWGNW